MLICSRVCAEFHDRNGVVIFRVDSGNRLKLVEAPDAIKQDPIYQLLLDEGSMEAVVSIGQRKRLENEPNAGADPSGKRPHNPEETDEVVVHASKASRKPKAKVTEISPDTVVATEACDSAGSAHKEAAGEASS